ncbi:helix-turn-helix domain-containing protein [Paenibacillus marinisediminis]
MSELGQMLKSARIEKGLSLDDVQEATKIRKRYLEAIEEGDYKVLPGSFYVRAFVKTYAETVGLNPDDVLQYYRNDIPTAEPEKTIEPLVRKKRSVQHNDRFGKWATTILMWSFVILIIVIIYFFIVSRDNNDSGKNAGNTDEISITDQVNPNKPGGKEDTGSKDAGTVTPTPQPEPKPEVVQDPIVVQQDPNRIVFSMAEGKTVPLELELTDEIWMSIKLKDKSGEKVASGNFDKGHKQKIDLTKDGLYMMLGNPTRAKLTINGQAIDLGTGLNKEIMITWQPYEDVKKLQEGQSTTTP